MWGWFDLMLKPSLPSYISQPFISKTELYIADISLFVMKLLVSVFLLLALCYLATAEVVASFTRKCDKFFFKDQPPVGPSGDQYKMICQKKTGGYEFATLYDISLRIPVYSAYEFQETGGCRRKTTWDIEPQLDDQNGGASMASEGTVRADLRGQKQALNGDYTSASSVYDKGHLVPVRHRNSQSCADATFTLTNAAPQHHSFNRGKWNQKEGEVANKLKTDCLNKGFHAYIVTGVVPGSRVINGRVNVPSYFWSAYCCRDNNNRPKFSGAYYGYNNETKSIFTVSIADLDAQLGGDYGTSFHLFSNNCV